MKLSKACYCVEERKFCNTELLKAKVSQLILYGYHLGIEESKNVYRPFRNLQLLDALFCMYDVTAVFPKYNNNFIKDLIHRIHFVGVSKSELEDPFVVKVSDLEICKQKSNECSDKEDLLREFIITSNYTNKLRNSIPNFHYSYAGLKVAVPKTQIDSEVKRCLVLCPCDTSNTIDYILFEKINGITLKDALKQKSVTVNDYLSWMLQIILSLEMAKFNFDFAHNNLTPENVILRKIEDDWIWKQKGKKFYLSYFHKNKIYYLKAKSVSVMVDFDLSRVEDYGVEGYEKKGIFKDESRPFYDLYKLIMWTLRILQQSNRELYAEVKKIAKFFGLKYEKELDQLLDREEILDYIYSLEVTDLEKSRSIADLIEFMVGEFPQMKHIFIDQAEFYEQPDVLDSSTLKLKSGFQNVMDYFNDLEDVLFRYNGLKRRVDLLKSLNLKMCNQDNFCEFSTYELKMAKDELSEFKEMITKTKTGLQLSETNRLAEYLKEINRLILLNNFQLKNYKETYLNDTNPYKNNIILNCANDEECKKLLNRYNNEEEKYKLKFITQHIWEKSNIIRGRLDIEFRKAKLVEDLQLLLDFEKEFELNSIPRTEFKLETLEDLCF